MAATSQEHVRASTKCNVELAGGNGRVFSFISRFNIKKHANLLHVLSVSSHLGDPEPLWSVRRRRASCTRAAAGRLVPLRSRSRSRL